MESGRRFKSRASYGGMFTTLAESNEVRDDVKPEAFKLLPLLEYHTVIDLKQDTRLRWVTGQYSNLHCYHQFRSCP